MSWQSYVDDNLVGTGKIEKAAIHGNPDKASWATSPGFTLSSTELDALLKALTDPSGIRANGLHLGGVKYVALKCDERSIYGKKGACGVICVKTNKAILVATYNEKTQPGEAAKVVEALGDYLINAGY